MSESTKPDQRVAQMAVLFWGLLSEQVGQGLLERLGVHAGNMHASLGVGVLDSNQEYVYEFIRLYGQSDLKDQLAVFCRGVVDLAEQAAKTVDSEKVVA